MKKLYALLVMFFLMGSVSAQVLVNETFENGNTVDQPPVGWISSDGGWKAGITIPDDNTARGRKPHTGDWYMYAKYNTDVWIYKEIQATAGEYYRVSFWYATWHVDHFNLEVKAGASADAASMTVPVVPMMVVANEDYEQTSGVFQATSSGSFYVGFHSVADNGPWYLSVDDVVIEQTAQYYCEVEPLTPDTAVYFGEPAYLRFLLSNTGEQSDTYQFTSTGSLPLTFYQNGTAVSQVTVPYNTAIELVAQTTLPMDLTDGEILHATFDVTSAHNVPVQQVDFPITALAPVSNYPLQEGFENDFVPFGWQNHIISGSYAFDRITSGSTPTAMPHNDSQYMARFYTYTNAEGNAAELVSPKLALNEEGNRVSFWVFRNGNHNINRADRFNVYYNTEPTAEGGQLLGTIHRCTFMEPVVDDVDDWYEYAFDFNSPTGCGFIIFEGVSAYGWNLYLDDIIINTTTVDHDAPTLVSVTGTQQYADTEMNLRMRVYDASGMPETLHALVIINCVGYDYDFVLDQGKDRGNYDYVLTLPAQANHIGGEVRVTLVDAFGNSDQVSFDVFWANQRPLLYETFEECSTLSIPDGWTTTGNPTWWDWGVQGTVYYEDYYYDSYVVAPHGGSRQAVLEWDSSEEPSGQDQTLVTPVLTIERPTVLEFWTWVQQGLDGFDHFQVRVYDTYDGTWETKWDAADLPGGQINAYQDPVSITLDEYMGRNIKIGFRGYNAYGDILAHDWFIDDVKVVATDTIPDDAVGAVVSDGLRLYPNPVKDRLYIESDASIHHWSLVAANGVMLEDRKWEGDALELDLSGYSKGVYVLRMVTDEGVITKKIVLSE
jgi:hypothetical protein